MRRLPDRGSDVLLGVFAVVVLSFAVTTVTAKDAPTSTLTTKPAAKPAVEPSASVPPPKATAASKSAGTIVLAGRDLARLRDRLATLTGSTVQVVDGAAPDVLAPRVLNDVTGTPRAVVLEVLAGSETGVRTTAAIDRVQNKWPYAQVVVVGPFSSDDRESAAAAKTAALAAKATFLDPVKLKWRTKDTSSTLTVADRTVVSSRLAAFFA